MENKITVLLGLQWGDEGKGKVIDILSPQYDFVVRYQGGANAGHSIVFNNKKYILHLIPSGIFTEHTKCVIGNGTVVDPDALLEEISLLENEGIKLDGRLFLSEGAHLILPYHKIIDAINESTSEKIGTTKRGIGPAYYSKYARSGIRFYDFMNEDVLYTKIERNLNYLKRIFPESEELNQLEPIIVFRDQMRKYPEYRKFITDTTELLNKALKDKQNILLEGAQGTLLDIDFGTYPYVTSSHPTAGGASTGSGIPPWKINSVIGVVKAYTTRVGEGPFPTELFDDYGKKIAERGVEFGATTGRPRRCGWLDLVALKYACEINGVTEIVLTKADVLDELDEIQVCIAYENNNLNFPRFIPYVDFLNNCKPVYKSFKGWKTPLNQFTEYKSLPPEFHQYVEFIESFVNTRISYISTGASREKMIIRN